MSVARTVRERQRHMEKEKRGHPRFEPALVNAIIRTNGGTRLEGWVLDVSLGGLAIEFPENSNLPDAGSNVEVTVASAGSANSSVTLGQATVQRTWPRSAYFDNGKGVALKLNDELEDTGEKRFLVQGTRQQTRVDSQARVAAQDIDHLSAYRRSLVECQMKYYTSTVTLSVSLAAAYFALNYYSIVTGKLGDPEMSLWRTLVAALPGIIATAFALIVSRKNATIHQVDAYLAHLKECSVRNDYPREYRGWETESRKYTYVMNTEKCKGCAITRQCGQSANNHPSVTQFLVGLFRNPPVDLYYVTIYVTFGIVLMVSIVATVTEVLRFQRDAIVYMAISSLITVIMIAAIVAIGFLVYRLRCGAWSFDHYKDCWKDLLSRCRESV